MPTILEEANALVYDGERQSVYGHPQENFDKTSHLWNGYLFAKFGANTPLLRGVDVANLMLMVKMARLMRTPDHRDSWVDMAGYVATGSRVEGVDE